MRSFLKAAWKPIVAVLFIAELVGAIWLYVRAGY